MSMISGQCDELRKKAMLLRGHADGLSAPYIIPSTKGLMALTMLDSAARMESAADTIWELRCKLVDMVDQRDEIDRLKAENVKLRELCKSMRCALVGHDDKVYLAALDDTLVDAGFDLQKLGVEVDG